MMVANIMSYYIQYLFNL